MTIVSHFVDHARADINALLARFLFATVDTTVAGGRPLTSNPSLQRLNFGCTLMVDILLAAVVLFASVRGIFERTLHARYSLKVTVPRVMAAIVMAHFSLLFLQMLIDLNNAMSHAAMSLGDQLSVDGMPWSASISAPSVNRLRIGQDLFHGVFALALVVAIVLLALAYVVRTALLNVLVVTAPLAALLWILPDTKTYARSWLRLLLVTIFMQTVQLIVLRVAIVCAFDHSGGLAESLYALATLYMMLKVPGALNVASHLETKAHTAAHHVERSVEKMLHPSAAHRRAT